MRVRWCLSIVAAALLTASGCGSDDVPDGGATTTTPSSTAVTEPERQLLRPSYPVSECCNQAAMAGGFKLAGDPSTGCVWFETVDGGARVSAVWPEGFTVSFDPLRVHDLQGKVFAEGGPTYGLGGSAERDPPEECRQDQSTSLGSWRVGQLRVVAAR